MMSYMEMLPIVTDLNMLWNGPVSAETTAKIAELTARLPPKEAVEYSSLLEVTASTIALQVPLLRRVKAAEKRLAELQVELEALQKACAVKWGPRRAANGETVSSLEAKIAAEKTAMAEAQKGVDAFEESVGPARKLLEGIDRLNQDLADLAAWQRRGHKGAVPRCVTEMLEWERKEFLEVAEVLPPLRPRA
jgi:hypothetical protein